MRTIIDIPESQKEFLDAYAKAHKLSRAEVIRHAIEAFSAEEHAASTSFAEVHGLWKGRDVDALEYENTVRCEW